MSEIQKYLKKVANRENLTEDEAVRTFQIMMMGGATPAQTGAMLASLRVKGESIDEMTGAARVLRSKCQKINAPEGAMDTCGTGGDGLGTYNISTATAIIVAACGVPVAKHGNRSISSLSGSAEVLQELGVKIDADLDIIQRSIDEANICFMMAPKFHKAMRHVAPIRQELNMRTIFNLIGPLSNPAEVGYHLLGVFSKSLTEPLAHVLKKLGAKRAWVVHGSDGLDEITITGKTHVTELIDGKISSFEISPEDYGLNLADPADIEGGSPQHNAVELKRVVSALQEGSAHQEVVLLNAAACLYVAQKVETVQEGVIVAKEAIESGEALNTLHKLVEITNS